MDVKNAPRARQNTEEDIEDRVLALSRRMLDKILITGLKGLSLHERARLRHDLLSSAVAANVAKTTHIIEKIMHSNNR